MDPESVAMDGPVHVSSGGEYELTPPRLTAFALRSEQHTIDCASGDRETGEWRGVRVGALIERAGPADDATHLLVTGADDYRVCVPLTAAHDALIAVERLDTVDDGLPRFMGSAVGGTRSVKRVRRVETVALAPGEAETEYEELTAAEPT